MGCAKRSSELGLPACGAEDSVRGRGAARALEGRRKQAVALKNDRPAQKRGTRGQSLLAAGRRGSGAVVPGAPGRSCAAAGSFPRRCARRAGGPVCAGGGGAGVAARGAFAVRFGPFGAEEGSGLIPPPCPDPLPARAAATSPE